jgi:hypothetical protein
MHHRVEKVWGEDAKMKTGWRKRWRLMAYMLCPPPKRKAGRPRIGHKTKTLAYTKPWALEGMGRATWFRRQKEKRDGRVATD